MEIQTSGTQFAKMGLNDNELLMKSRKIIKTEEIFDKGTLKESLEKQKKTPLFIIIFLILINCFFLGIMIVALYIVFKNDSFLRDQEEEIILSKDSLTQLITILTIRDGFRDLIILNE